jgi:hypothetical protein
MIAVFASYALPALFIATGVFAATVLFLTWRTYGREIAAIRALLKNTGEDRDFSVSIATVETHDYVAGPRRGSIRRAAAVRSRQKPGMRVAA